MNDIWRSAIIEGFENCCAVSIDGTVKTLQRYDRIGRIVHERIRKTHLNRGYEILTIKKDGEETTEKVHNIVAKAFPEICGEWFDGCDVHHKDFDRSNNNAHNLIVLTKEEHSKLHHNESMYDKFEETKVKNGRFNIGKKIKKYSLNGEFIEEYRSINKAAKENNISRWNLSTAIKNNKTCGGYKWKLSA